MYTRALQGDEAMDSGREREREKKAFCHPACHSLVHGSESRARTNIIGSVGVIYEIGRSAAEILEGCCYSITDIHLDALFCRRNCPAQRDFSSLLFAPAVACVLGFFFFFLLCKTLHTGRVRSDVLRAINSPESFRIRLMIRSSTNRHSYVCRCVTFHFDVFARLRRARYRGR